jgi:hypothetical protein
MLTFKSNLDFIVSKGYLYGKAITAYSYSFQQCTGDDRSVCIHRTNALREEVTLFVQRAREVV